MVRIFAYIFSARFAARICFSFPFFTFRLLNRQPIQAPAFVLFAGFFRPILYFTLHCNRWPRWNAPLTAAHIDHLDKPNIFIGSQSACPKITNQRKQHKKKYGKQVPQVQASTVRASLACRHWNVKKTRTHTHIHKEKAENWTGKTPKYWVRGGFGARLSIKMRSSNRIKNRFTFAHVRSVRPGTRQGGAFFIKSTDFLCFFCVLLLFLRYETEYLRATQTTTAFPAGAV